MDSNSTVGGGDEDNPAPAPEPSQEDDSKPNCIGEGVEKEYIDAITCGDIDNDSKAEEKCEKRYVSHVNNLGYSRCILLNGKCENGPTCNPPPDDEDFKNYEPYHNGNSRSSRKVPKPYDEHFVNFRSY
jgi:hypothetical protein